MKQLNVEKVWRLLFDLLESQENVTINYTLRKDSL